jgi:hypothetical protein
MKMLDVGLAGLDEAGKSLCEAINSLKLLKQLLEEVNENGNTEFIEEKEEEKK